MKVKFFIVFMLAAALCLSACGGTESAPEATPAADEYAGTAPAPESQMPASEPAQAALLRISSTICDDYGFYHYVCDETGQYEFIHESGTNADISWSVYILDEEFTDAERFIGQAHNAVLEGGGVCEVSQGQYIYLYCSANSWTGIEADAADCMLVRLH